MKEYYSIVEFSGDETPLYLGKIPLVETPDGVGRKGYSDVEPIATNGTVPFPWGDEDSDAVPLPATVDTGDPFQVAPMASFYQRPYGDLSDVIEGSPETVHVFTTDTDNETNLSDIEAAEHKEEVIEEKAGGDIKQIKRWYEWDETVVNTGSPSESSVEFSAAQYLVGFVDGQDMHDAYTHLGVSTADDAPQALYNILERIRGTPLWSPEAYSVNEHRSFNADDVLRTAPVPALS
jgi:hypothetical protein